MKASWNGGTLVITGEIAVKRLRQGARITVVRPSHPVRRTLHYAGLDDPAYITEDA